MTGKVRFGSGKAVLRLHPPRRLQLRPGGQAPGAASGWRNATRPRIRWSATAASVAWAGGAAGAADCLKNARSSAAAFRNHPIPSR